MEQYTGFSAHASLATIGLWMKDHNIWQMVEQEVKIKQKTIKHQPHEKLKDALINILAGGQGIVEVNKRVRTDKALRMSISSKKFCERCINNSPKDINTITKKHICFWT